MSDRKSIAIMSNRNFGKSSRVASEIKQLIAANPSLDVHIFEYNRQSLTEAVEKWNAQPQWDKDDLLEFLIKELGL